MKKKITIILSLIILLFILISFGIYYLNTYYLPKKVKIEITKALSDKLNSIVKLEDIKFNLFKGIVLYNLEIINKRDAALLLKIENISASFLFLPSLKQKRIILPSINIKNAVLNIIRYEDKKFNIQDLIPKQDNINKSSLAIPLFIYKINVADSDITFLDKTTQPNSKQLLKVSNLKAQTAPSGINFKIDSTLSNEKQSSELEVSGKFEFKTRELKFSSRIDKLDVTAYELYLKNLPLTIDKLLLRNIFSDCTLTADKASIKSYLEILDASLKNSDASLSHAQAELKTVLTIDFKNTSALDYIISIDRLKADLSHPQLPKETSIENANLQISPNRLNIKSAKINAAETAFQIKGNLEDFQNPVFNIDLQSTIELSAAKDFLNNRFNFLNSLVVSGKADLDVDIAKSKDIKDLEFKGSLNLENAYLKTKNNPYEIKGINGRVEFDQENISWQNVSFLFLDKIFSSQAAISNFKMPQIALDLRAENIGLSFKIKSIQKNIFDIEFLKANYFNSVFNITGGLQIMDENNYYAEWDIQSQFELNDLKQIKKLPQEIMSQINPQGRFEINGKIQGNLKNPALLNASLNIESSELKLYGLRLGSLKMQLIQENKQVKVPPSTCGFYVGNISLNGLIDLEKEGLPYAFKITASDIDLSLLIRDTALKDKTFAGILNSTLILAGPLNSLLDVKGQGNFNIRDGYLWEFDPLKKLGNFLFIPHYQSLIFRQASADFSIQEKKAFTDNLTLDSNIITLDCDGYIDFFGNLDFEIAPKPIGEIIPESEKYKNIFNKDILAGISIVKLTGTINDPKVSTKIVPGQVLDKLKDSLKGSVDKFKGITDLIFGGQE